MNNGPTKKQKTNSGEPVTPLQLKGDIPIFIHMAKSLSTDLFMHNIKDLSFKTLSMFHILLHYDNDHLVGLSAENKKLLPGLIGKLLSPAAKDTWKNLLIKLNNMDPSIIVEAPAGHKNDALWYFRAVMQASHAIYQRQNEEITHLKRKHPNHKHWAVIDTQDISANEVTLEFLMTRHQQLDAFNQSIIMSKIDLLSNRLNLNNSGITRIPETLFHDESLATYWRNVVEFECADTIICHLPNSIGNLSSLRTLKCDDNQLQQLPDSIGNLVALQKLNCHHNQLQQLPDSIGNLVALEELYCSNNHLQQLPGSIGNLVALQRLYCSNNQLQQLPSTLGNLVALQSLGCSKNHLQQLPGSIGNLVALQRLGCSNNQLQQLPGTLGNLVALQSLYCSSNHLQQLPDSIGNLVALQRLGCSNNQLQQLPDSIGNLVALQELNCSANKLQQLPDSIGNLVALQELDCSNNQLQQLPDSIGNLAAMYGLHCENNRLRALPNVLQHKFGDTWCRKILANQDHHPISRPSILTQYTEATAQPQPGEKRAERTSEASASEEANDNADVLKRHKP